MAGAAKTKNFMLSTATVMIGPPEDLHKLNPDAHSLGLVKNFQMSADPTYIELSQGIKNATVMSVKSNDGIKCSFEVYEYTAKNLAYAAGLDGSSMISTAAMKTIWIASAAYAKAGKTIEVSSDITSDLGAGDYVFLQNGVDDKVHIAKIASAVYATTKTTITIATGYEPDDDVGFPVGSRIGKVKRLDIGNEDVQPEFSAKVVGLLPKDNAPFTILYPKVKVTKGLGVAFQTDNFGNLPFELTPYAGVPDDPFYSEYAEASAILFPR